MNVDDLIERCEEFQARYTQVFGAMATLLADNESASAAENVLEMRSLVEGEFEFWTQLAQTLTAN